MAVTGGAAPFLIVIAVLFLVVAILPRTRRRDGDAAPSQPVLGHLHLLKRPPLHRSPRRRGQGAAGVAAAGPRGGRCSRRRTPRRGGALHGVRRRDGGEAPGCSPWTSSVCEFFQGSHQYILENPNNCTFEEEREKSQRRNFIYLLDKGICMTNPPHLLTVVKKVCSFITWDGYQYMSNQFGRTNAVALPLKKGAGFELILQQDLHY
uniref:Uncharacterized protein n=1 Tax=Oryza sativa subsp. japonica TaxID=39947 RepID=Q2QN24_ORYSJ|nr:hypothetical protein LOC_Os12g39230 [Oryza sativa Japonica Group]